MVGSLNPISVAFAVLFVGIGVDFGIQFSVRYRAERYEVDDLRIALANAARHVGVPLTLAAAATAAGFLSFLPTDYQGVSELGQIAGVGMIIAYLDQHHAAAGAAAAVQSAGRKGAARLCVAGAGRSLHGAAPHPDHRRHRAGCRSAACRCSIILQFDFNPINLRSPKVESIATYPRSAARSQRRRQCHRRAGARSLADAREIAERLRKVPEVDARHDARQLRSGRSGRRSSRSSSRPRATLEPAFKATPRPAADRRRERRGAQPRRRSPARGRRHQTGAGRRGREAPRRRSDQARQGATRRLRERAAGRVRLAAQDRARRACACRCRRSTITDENMPPEVARDWIAADGRARVEAHPEGRSQRQRGAAAIRARGARGRAARDRRADLDPGDPATPSCAPSSRPASGRFVSIAILLWIVLRRFSDVLLTLVPLLLAGVVTLEICVADRAAAQFRQHHRAAAAARRRRRVQDLLHHGVAGRPDRPAAVGLTRAVIFSAMTTATAFGSLWLSSHPGTSSMGKLLALSLRLHAGGGGAVSAGADGPAPGDSTTREQTSLTPCGPALAIGAFRRAALGLTARAGGRRTEHARPVLAAAEDAAQHAALDLHHVGAQQPDAAFIGLAVLGVVDLALPSAPRSCPSSSTVAVSCRAGSACPGWAGCAAPDRGSRCRAPGFCFPGHDAPQRAAAVLDPDMGESVLDQPLADRRLCGHARALLRGPCRNR